MPKLTTLVTVDLSFTGLSDPSTKRKDFYEELKKRNWNKVAGVTTGWRIHWPEGKTQSSALAEIKEDLRAAIAATSVATSRVSAYWHTGVGDFGSF
tara:strand:+ start:6621 stop:6908 length:288 start_codon:yes stop_codon:yes gene_type:complete